MPPEITINFSKSAFTVTGPSDALSKTTRTGEYNEKSTAGTEETQDAEATPAMTTLTF